MSTEQQAEAAENPFAEEIHNFLDRFYKDLDQDYRRIRPTIWKVYENGYDFDVILLSKMLIFDALIFDEMPDNKLEFFEELLSLNSLQTKSSKLCLDHNEIRLRLIKQKSEYPYDAFAENLIEFRYLFDEFRNLLLPKYFQ